MSDLDGLRELAVRRQRGAVSLPSPEECRAIRLNAKLTLWELAKAVGVTGPTVWQWESGHWAPKPENADRYAAALQVLKDAVDSP